MIKNDIVANKTITKIKKAQNEMKRLEKIAKQEILEIELSLKNQCKEYENIIERNTEKLKAYFMSGETEGEIKEQTSQYKYKLVSGNLYMKKPKIKFDYIDEDFIKWLKDNHRERFVQQKEKVRWRDYKKLLDVRDGKVIDVQTGEVIPVIKAKESPPEFVVK